MCQPSDPGLNPGMSRSETAITGGNPIMLLPPKTFSCTTCLREIGIRIRDIRMEILGWGYQDKRYQDKGYQDKGYQDKGYQDKG